MELTCTVDKLKLIYLWFFYGARCNVQIMKGFSQWKLSAQEFTANDLQFAIQESMQLLFQTPVDEMEDEKSKVNSNHVGGLQETVALPVKSISELWKTAQMARARLFVIMSSNW